MDRVGKYSQKYDNCKGTLFAAARIFAGIGLSQDIMDPNNLTGPTPTQTEYISANTPQSVPKFTQNMRASPPTKMPITVSFAINYKIYLHGDVYSLSCLPT